MTSRETLSSELTILGIDVSQHLMDHHHQLLREFGATDAAHLRALHPGQRVLVAGVRASTQTPASYRRPRAISELPHASFMHAAPGERRRSAPHCPGTWSRPPP